MKRVTITDDSINGILPDTGEDVVLMRDGHAVALVTPFDDDDMEWYAQEHDPRFIESIQRARQQAASGQTISHEDLVRDLGVRSTKELLAEMLQPNGGLSVAAAETQTPDEPGFYAIFVDDPRSLPAFVHERLESQQASLLYIGIASQSLRRRMFEQDLRHKSSSTFFRTLGAVLNFRPQPGSLQERANQQNYRFSDSDTRAIVRWIEGHLRLKWLVAHCVKSELETREEALIRRACPAFNLNHNPRPIEKVKELRECCRRIACGTDKAA